MSMPEQASLTCPACAHPQTITLWKSINVTLDRSLKGQLLKGEINLFKCEKCHEEAWIPIDLLYHDMEAKVMIYLIYPDKDDGIDIEALRNSPIKAPSRDYKLRVVTSLRQVIEKIFIFDHRLDDRIIELLKFAMWEGQAGTEQLPEDRLFYHGLTEGNELILALYDSSGNSRNLAISWDSYRDASVWMHDLLSGHSEGETSWLIVNQALAREMAGW